MSIVSGNNGKPEVVFDAATHTYTRTDTGEELVSVSRFVKLYSLPFDKDGEILKKCAARKGIAPEELSRRWKKKGSDAAERGTRIHAALQAFIETGKIKEGPDDDIVAEFAKIRFKGKLESEKMLWSLDWGIAGTTDLVEYFPDGSVSLFDFKTNERLKNTAFFGKGKPPQMMLPPVSHFHDASLPHYRLQISAYAYLLDLQGYWIRDLAIFWINPKSRELERIAVDYLRGDVRRMLADFRAKTNS